MLGCNRGLLPGVLLTCLAALALQAVPARLGAATSVAFTKTRVAGIYISLVTTNLNDHSVRVTPAIAKRGIGTSESFRSILRRTRPAAAINGTFFCTRSLEPTGDIVIDRQLIARGSVGTAIGFGPGNEVTFMPSRRADLYRWYDYQHVLGAGPALILRGKTIVLPRDQGFFSSVHYSRKKRAAVGLTSANKLLFVTTGNPVYLSELARVMKALGCTDAAVLDGGSSVGLYWRGKLVVNPTRLMTNCLLVYDDPYSYERHRPGFRPAFSASDSQPLRNE